MKEAEKWLEKAKKDLEAATDMFRVKKYEYAAFWCQQAAEKALKALQIERENKFDKIHDLVLLSQKVGAPKDILEVCKKLTLAYTYTRYPDVELKKQDMKKISEKFIKDTGEILKWARRKL